MPEQANIESSDVFKAKIGNGKEGDGSDDLKLANRNEINLQSRKKRRSRMGRMR
jgi:hypothetical protein